MSEQGELEQQIIKAAKGAIADAVKSELVGYNKPLNKLVDNVVSRHGSEIRQLLDAAMKDLMTDADFVNEVNQAVRQKVARLIVNSAEGEVGKQFNEIRQDPERRAKVTTAIASALDSI